MQTQCAVFLICYSSRPLCLLILGCRVQSDMVSLDLAASSGLSSSSDSEDLSSHATLELQIRTHGEAGCCCCCCCCSWGAVLSPVPCCMVPHSSRLLSHPVSSTAPHYLRRFVLAPHHWSPSIGSSSMLTAAPLLLPAAMHERAEMGDAAHAAYKGGLDAQQALQLKALTDSVLQRAAAAAAAASSAAAAGGGASSGYAAAEALFRHLDQNGDGRIRWGRRGGEGELTKQGRGADLGKQRRGGALGR